MRPVAWHRPSWLGQPPFPFLGEHSDLSPSVRAQGSAAYYVLVKHPLEFSAFFIDAIDCDELFIPKAAWKTKQPFIGGFPKCFFVTFFFLSPALQTSLVFSKDFGLLVFVRKSLTIDEVS